MANIELELALRPNARNEALLTGRARPQGIDLRTTRLVAGDAPPPSAQVAEIPLAHHLAAVGRGDDQNVGVPVFSERGFPHTGLVVTAASGVSDPASLAGKRVGVADLLGSEALWTRGALAHSFGVSELQWFSEGGGGAALSRDTTVAEELRAGRLDGGLLSAGVPAELAAEPALRRLFSDPRAEARRYHEATGLFPMLSVVVVRKDVVDRFPWVVLNLYSAFLDSKGQAISETGALLAPYLDTGVIDAGTARALGGDLYPYGVTQQKDALETALEFAHEQGLSPATLGLGEVFYPPTLEL